MKPDCTKCRYADRPGKNIKMMGVKNEISRSLERVPPENKIRRD